MERTTKKLVVLGAGTAGTMIVNKLRRRLPREEWSITVVDPRLPRGIRPLIRELDAIIENDKGRRLSSLLTAPRSASSTVDPQGR